MFLPTICVVVSYALILLSKYSKNFFDSRIIVVKSIICALEKSRMQNTNDRIHDGGEDSIELQEDPEVLNSTGKVDLCTVTRGVRLVIISTTYSYLNKKCLSRFVI